RVAPTNTRAERLAIASRSTRATAGLKSRRLERDPRAPREVLELPHDRQHERNAFARTHALRFAFGIAGEDRTARPGRRLRRAERAHEVVDLPLELSLVDERVDPHRSEEVADAHADRARRHLLLQREGRRERPPVRARQ